MTDLAKLAAGLTEADRKVIADNGVCFGRSFYAASIMSALVRKGFFIREDQKGFRPAYHPTDICVALCRHLLDQEKKG